MTAAEVHGDFEIHLTVAGNQGERLAAFAAEHDLKFTQIELAGGN